MNYRFVAGCVMVASAGVQAQPLLVDFEQVAGMANAPGATIPAASRLSTFYLASHGVRFSTGGGSDFVAVVTHGSGTPSGTRIIGGATAASTLTYNKVNPLVAEFFDPTGGEPWVVSTVSVRGDLFPVAGTKTLQAFDLSGAMLQQVTLEDSNSAALAISAPGIHRVVMFSSSATVGFDDLRFDRPAPGCRCAADFDGSGGTPDATDIDAFFTAWLAGDPVADADCSGGTPDTTDIDAFFGAWLVGGC